MPWTQTGKGCSCLLTHKPASSGRKNMGGIIRNMIIQDFITHVLTTTSIRRKKVVKRSQDFRKKHTNTVLAFRMGGWKMTTGI